MIVYVVVLRDRHNDDAITLHASLDGADGANEQVNSYIAWYQSQSGSNKITWTERTYGRPEWIRYVDTYDEGPNIRIEQKELKL